MVYPTALALAVISSLVVPPRPQEWPTDALTAARSSLARGDRGERLAALEALVELGGTAALDAVIDALADHDAYVAERAQTLVVQLERAGALDELIGRRGVGSKDAWIRQRAAEAIGRLQGPVEAQLLLRHVKKNDPALARTLLWSMQRLAERGVLTGKKQRTVKSLRGLSGRGDNDPLRAAALQTLCILDPRGSSVALDTLCSTRGPETACALVDMAVRLKPRNYGYALNRALSHRKAGVRMRALDLINTVGVQRHELVALVDRLDREPRAAIRRRALETLQYFTGSQEGEDRDAWQALLETLPPDWTPAGTVTVPIRSLNLEGSIERLDELDPVSDRIAILVDVSHSYWRAGPRGHTMSTSVSPAVGRILARIEQTGSFLLLPFAERPIPFSARPLLANRANVKRATEYLLQDLPRDPHCGGGSNISAAIDYALGFAELDRVLIISASSEYVGQRANVRMMVNHYAERTRFRPAVFDFALLNVHAGSTPIWFALANARGGRGMRLWVP